MNKKRIIALVGTAALLVGIVAPLGVGAVLAGAPPTTTVPPAPTPVSVPFTTVSGLVPTIVSGAIRVAPKTVPPVRVEVPTVGVAVDVMPVGIADDGKLQIPADVHIAGWYQYGPVPASTTGTTVIAAHVDSLDYGIGPFAKLKNLSVGDPILVTTSDGIVHTYSVQSIDSVLKSELPVDSIFDRSGSPRLALITCGGPFDYGSRTYADNVVVTALPVKP
jgi:LPXTG-site transpeptidase (sortase) family protein